MGPEPGEFSYAQREVRIVFGEGAVERSGAEIEACLEATRPLLVSTPGRTAAVERARGALGPCVADTFDGAEPHVPTVVVARAVDRARAADSDCVVAIGGGSAIGLGKALVRELGVPLVAVPTTYSGSEMTDIWGVSDGDRKETGRDPRCAARLVLYDPELTRTLPVRVTGASGMNAIAHAVEALYSPNGWPLAGLIAADGLRRVADALPVLASDPGDRSARRQALWGAHLCGRALDAASMGLHHKLCHVLGGTLGLPHAETHAALLPYVTAHNAPAAPEAMRTIASILAVPEAARGLWELGRAAGVTGTLADLGVKPADLDRVIARVTDRPYPNPTPVTAEDVRAILTRAVDGGPPS